jgi:DNA primase
VPAINTPAEVYARNRGITMDLPPTIRFVMTPRWRNPETGEVGRDHPAMVCALQNADRAVVGVQCVFLADGGRRKYERTYEDGTKAKAKLTWGLIVGSALRLGPVSDHVTLCEGPEDGLSLAQELPGRTVWVACGTALMPRVNFPAGIDRITLAGDNGGPGREAVEASTVAYLDQGFAVAEAFPNPAFKDWNDQLRGIHA